jgi:DNA-binding HxlR family transcriptional regulator
MIRLEDQKDAGAGHDRMLLDHVIDWDAVSIVIDVVSCKWVLAVVAELADGPKRHNQLSRSLQLDHKRLGRVLRRAQQAQIVTRKADVLGPQPCSQYQLTRYGQDLLPILAAFGSWRQGCPA